MNTSSNNHLKYYEICSVIEELNNKLNLDTKLLETLKFILCSNIDDAGNVTYTTLDNVVKQIQAQFNLSEFGAYSRVCTLKKRFVFMLSEEDKEIIFGEKYKYALNIQNHYFVYLFCNYVVSHLSKEVIDLHECIY